MRNVLPTNQQWLAPPDHAKDSTRVWSPCAHASENERRSMSVERRETKSFEFCDGVAKICDGRSGTRDASIWSTFEHIKNIEFDAMLCATSPTALKA